MVSSAPLIEVVALILMRWDAKIVVEKRKPGKGYPGKLGLVGGKVEAPETHEQACIREAAEETGLAIEPGSLVPICATVSEPYRISSYYATWTGLSQFNLESTWTGLEGQEMYWKSLEDLCNDPHSLTPATLQAVSTVLPHKDVIPRSDPWNRAPNMTTLPTPEHVRASSPSRGAGGVCGDRGTETPTAKPEPEVPVESDVPSSFRGTAPIADPLPIPEHVRASSPGRGAGRDCDGHSVDISPTIMRRATASHTSIDDHWRPVATSTNNRAASHVKTKANSLTASVPPTRYSDAASLAPSAGHELTSQAAPEPAGIPKKAMLPPVTPASDGWRTEEMVLSPAQATTFEREYFLPLHADFVLPAITHFAFHEHTGHIREAWRQRGYISASVADRPCIIPPSDNCYHFIGQVYDFVQYVASQGLRIYAQTSHVECGPAAWASWKVWPEKIRDGRMLQAAEELLWTISIGERSFAEQPHTAHEHLIGPPTFVANANQHGGNDKTWCVWSRMAGVLLPTNTVPQDERRSILASVSGSRDERMLKRSGTEPEMAAAIVRSIDQHHGPCTELRPANVPCSQYATWRRSLHHNFGILAASYAPMLTAVDIMARNAPCALLLPIAPSPKGALIMVPLRGHVAFGIVLSETESYKAQAERASAFLNVGIETHHLHRMRDERRHLVVAVPWDMTPVCHADTPAALTSAQASKAPAVWVHPHALQDSPLLEPALCAVQRLLAMGAAVTNDDLEVGVWDAAKPVVLRRQARQYGSLPANPTAGLQWEAFLNDERERATVMQRDLHAADCGTGLTAGTAADVRTAADYASELPVPPQGLPAFIDPSLIYVRAPEPPLALHTDWLHRLPPQQVPPGFTSVSYTDALRRWARRLIADTKNTNMRFDAHCLQHGEAPAGTTRAPDIVLGRGAGKHIPHADGVGSFNVLDIMLETDSDGSLVAFDFERPDRRTWVFEAIKRHIGATTDQEMMSFFYHGVRWKLKAPKQIRILHNIRRLDTRISKVNKKLAELASKGYISAHPICKVHDGLTEDGPNPFLYLFEWDCPLGGADKPGKPDVARVLGDMSAPRGVRERNEPDGEPTGPEVESFNELSGPKGGVKPDFEGYAPFPDPEIKPRPRHKYTATAYLSYYAHLANTFCVTLDDDQVDCFFQYHIAEEELPLCRWNTVDLIDGHMWSIAYKVYTMNQGGRNSSKIACRGNELWLDAWRRRMDTFVAQWLPRQTTAMQQAYAQRLDKMGFKQARPFWAALYTDNFDFTFSASELAAAGTFLWKEMNSDAHIRMQPHVAYGTCSDWIGGRYLVTAGFGCIAPSKRERAIANVKRSLTGSLSRELFEKNNSFLVHVADICDWPTESLKGIYGPLKRPGFDDEPAIMTPIATTRLRTVLELLRNRPLASFWSGVVDAQLDWPGVGAATKPIRVHAFDTCTDPLPTPSNPNPSPHVAGMVDGMYWRYKLEGEWLNRHITLTEGIGPAIGALKTVPLFPEDINVLASDATAAAAAGIDRAQAAHMQAMRITLKEEHIFQQHAHTMWHTHWKGWGNGIVDSLSRDDIRMAHRIAHAFGIKLVEIDISNDAAIHRFLRRTLIRTRPDPPDAFPIFIKGVHGNTLVLTVGPADTIDDVLERYMVEEGDGNADCRLTKSGKELKHDDTMERLGIGKDDVLHALLRVRAGMRDEPDPPSPLATPRRASIAATRACSAVTSSSTPPASPTSGLQSRASPSSHGRLDSVPWLPPQADPVPPTQPRALTRPAPLIDVPDTTITAATRQGSPQPLTASAARKAAARVTADSLTEDTSEYAVCKGDPGRLVTLLGEITEAKMAGIPKGTAKSNEWGWKWVVAFGSDTNTRWMSPHVDSPDINLLTERWRTALCLFWIAQHMKASTRRQQLGIDKAKPTSPLLAVYAWRRVLRDCDRHLSDLSHVRDILKGLCALCKRQYGPEAFAVHQARILSLPALIAIATALQSDSTLAWSTALTLTWRAAHRYLTATGERKDGFTSAFTEDDCLSRNNLTWLDADGAELPSTPDNIASRGNGDLLKGTPPCSKCDRLGITWSKQKQFFRYDDNDPLNFPVAWQQWELVYPCPTGERRQWPAFSPTGDDKPFSPQQAAETHKQLVIHSLGMSGAADVTIHSYRATLVSAMYVAKSQGKHQFTEGVMQAHVRHKTLDAMYGYGKMTPGDFADNVAVITSTDASLARRDKLPEHEPAGAVQCVEAIIQELSLDDNDGARRAARANKAPEADLGSPKPRTVAIEGSASPVATHELDTWNVIGTSLKLPNEIWNEGAGESTCNITHFLYKHVFPDGGTHVAYAVSIDGYEGLYAVRADTIARHVPQPLRRKLSKQPLPRPAKA